MLGIRLERCLSASRRAQIANLKSLLWALCVLCGGLPVFAQAPQLPQPAKPDYPLAVPMAYADDAAAQAAWKPMGGTAAAAVVRFDGGRQALRMPCNFKGSKIERASWDHAVNLDLAACQGMQFRFFCRDAMPVAHFSFYLQSGAGWYAGSFAAEDNAGWNSITVEKSATRTEGTPAGWGKIGALRISAWRSSDTDTEFYVADFGLLGANAAIAIIRGESVTRNSPQEAESVGIYAEAVAQALKGLDLPFAVISDLDVTAERLKSKKLLILPHNPGMPDEVVKRLGAFLDGGGKLIAFFGFPEKLDPAVGIESGRFVAQKRPGHFAAMRFAPGVIAGAPPVVAQRSWNIREAKAVAGKSRVAAVWDDDAGNPTGDAAIVVSGNCIQMTHVLLADDPANKRQMMLALVGHFLPEVWEQAARKSIERIGCFGPFKGRSFAEASRALESAAGTNEELRRQVSAAGSARMRALKLCDDQAFSQAMPEAAHADALLLAAYCASLKAQAGEHRAFWCHSAFGVQGLDWDAAIKLLAGNGFTAILPNMLWGGTAYYESSVLPVAPEVREKGDQLAKCLAACKKYGVQTHVWKVNWNTGGRAPRGFLETMKAAGRTQVRFDGKPEDTWLCPSHPANQKLELDAMLEVAKRYEVDGIHFDYIRYPGPDACFCPGCRERFEALIGGKVRNWPADLRRDEELRRKWLDFRRDNITKVVAAVSDAARQAKPGIRISAAVFSNWQVDRDNVGQDWKLWCEKGYLDFVCPMDYTPENSQFENLVKQQLGWAGRVPCYPGIGLSCWPLPSDVCKLIEQIQFTRRLKTGGFTIFNYDPAAARDVVPLCGTGITRKP